MLQFKLRQIGTALAALTPNCYHYFRPVQNFPCIVWAETGEDNSFYSDNRKSEQRIVGTVDCFTRIEFDGLLDDIQGAFEALGLTWSLATVQYETETKLIHYTWDWGVVADGETQTSGS
jgi:hypothetical protein